ncbi:uncharacterized protein Z518_03562 [Rhinocladiella mackenziei CBS 650.93]|uniref:Uncharacterized protein n=1 Tax=Rhinocladiella mackenziei CBS 650.93 TaxID=1442369 RepID=A0A0D2JHU1_9EURO|nr:uncharacterized protein Z518_03562 [Rhinocladiella mackenziei CBS 650.93]KIX08905.1 hypothetical protein Z518_03562 [Rhinocladiella mackenziei CBS 650.93]
MIHESCLWWREKTSAKRRCEGRSTTEGEIVNLQQARDATALGHTLSIRHALRFYAPAILWTFLFSTGNVMVGFDPQLTGILIAIPQFQRQYGQFFNGSYVVKAEWQSAFNLGAPLGAVPGLLLAELMDGLLIGGYTVVVPTHISEIAPAVLRGIATALINIFQVSGQLICSAVLHATRSRKDRWSYVRKCKDNEQARKALDRLTTKGIDTDTLLANIILTIQLEEAQHDEVRCVDLFKGSDRRRTIISTPKFSVARLLSLAIASNAFGLGLAS